MEKTLHPGYERMVYFAGGYDPDEIRHQYHAGYYLKVVDENTLSLKSIQLYKVTKYTRPDPQVFIKDEINSAPELEGMLDEEDKTIIARWFGKERG